jgi:hypothetical protein
VTEKGSLPAAGRLEGVHLGTLSALICCFSSAP